MNRATPTHRRAGLFRRSLIVPGLLLLTATLSCEQSGPELAPVEGKVVIDGEPLRFGSVMFQAKSGQPARGIIQEDGTFELTTYEPGDGAHVGVNRVRVTQFASQSPKRRAENPDGEPSLGELLIPRRYTRYETSGITVTVKPDGNRDVLISLTRKSG